MRILLVLCSVLIACSGDDTSDVEPVDKSDTDGASDTDTDTDTDSDADSDTDSDADSDTDTDTNADTAETGIASSAIVWSGSITLSGTTEIGEFESLVIDAGTQVAIDPGAKLDIRGTVTANGTSASPVVFAAPGGWDGIEVWGSLTADYLDISGAGGALTLREGAVTLTDSTLDLEVPMTGPDCTKLYAGDLVLDHVRFTGCHCPLHISGLDSLTVTNSIFDGASVAMMISNATGAVNDSHLLGSNFSLQDIGGSFSVDVAGNFYGGGAPTVQVLLPTSEFLNENVYSTTPLPGVGPR